MAVTAPGWLAHEAAIAVVRCACADEAGSEASLYLNAIDYHPGKARLAIGEGTGGCRQRFGSRRAIVLGGLNAENNSESPQSVRRPNAGGMATVAATLLRGDNFDGQAQSSSCGRTVAKIPTRSSLCFWQVPGEQNPLVPRPARFIARSMA